MGQRRHGWSDGGRVQGSVSGRCQLGYLWERMERESEVVTGCRPARNLAARSENSRGGADRCFASLLERHSSLAQYFCLTQYKQESLGRPRIKRKVRRSIRSVFYDISLIFFSHPISYRFLSLLEVRVSREYFLEKLWLILDLFLLSFYKGFFNSLSFTDIDILQICIVFQRIRAFWNIFRNWFLVISNVSIKICYNLL